MTKPGTTTDRIRSLLVLAATAGTIAFNWLAAIGYVGGVTPEQVSDKYPTVVTPAGYAFTIWSLIYVGLTIFSVYQLMPGRAERYRPVRSLYIFSAALNCAWIFFWHSEQIAVCFAILFGLVIVLYFLNSRMPNDAPALEAFLVRGAFGLYLGWTAAAALVNFAALLVYANIDLGNSAPVVGAALLLVAAAFGVFVRVRSSNYFAPLAVAWALTAVAVKQSGNTLVVSAAAVGVVACLIAAVSFVLKLQSSNYE
jgi:hypothetical protein